MAVGEDGEAGEAEQAEVEEAAALMEAVGEDEEQGDKGLGVEIVFIDEELEVAGEGESDGGQDRRGFGEMPAGEGIGEEGGEEDAEQEEKLAHGRSGDQVDEEFEREEDRGEHVAEERVAEGVVGIPEGEVSGGKGAEDLMVISVLAEEVVLLLERAEKESGRIEQAGQEKEGDQDGEAEQGEERFGPFH